MLTFVILWTYMSFCQLLVIWMGNIKEEVSWYIHRFNGGWKWVGGALLLFDFFVPFFMLLGKNNKRNFRILAIIAGIILVMRLTRLLLAGGAGQHARQPSHFPPVELPNRVGRDWRIVACAIHLESPVAGWR